VGHIDKPAYRSLLLWLLLLYNVDLYFRTEPCKTSAKVLDIVLGPPGTFKALY